MKKILAIIFFLYNTLFVFSQEEEKEVKVRLNLKLLDFCLGSAYNGGFIGVQSGFKVEGFLLKDKLIPEFQYNHGWIDIERLTWRTEEIKPFSDIKLGLRIGKFRTGDANFRTLSCIDRYEKSADGKTLTEYYEQENVSGDLHVGFAGGIYYSRAFMGKPFTKESGVEGSLSLNTTSFYGGIGVTKTINNEPKIYKSGNVCIWDRYTYYYINGLFALNHTMGENYYYAGSPNPVAGSNSYPAIASQVDNIREFRPYGLIIGVESGRFRRGFVGSFELGIIPALKGNGFFFKTGANIALGF